MAPVEMFTLEPGRSRISGLSHAYLIKSLALAPGTKLDLLATAYLESGKRIHATFREFELETEQPQRQNK